MQSCAKPAFTSHSALVYTGSNMIKKVDEWKLLKLMVFWPCGGVENRSNVAASHVVRGLNGPRKSFHVGSWARCVLTDKWNLAFHPSFLNPTIPINPRRNHRCHLAFVSSDDFNRRARVSIPDPSRTTCRFEVDEQHK